MRDFLSLSQWTNPVVVTGAFLTNNIFNSLFTKVGVPEYHMVGPILLSVVGMIVADKVVGTIVERIRLFRRALAGIDYIEGEWINTVATRDNPKNILGVEFCVIRYSAGQYKVMGDTWDIDGRHLHNFSSEGSNYTGRELEYYYKTGLDKIGGYGKIIFSPIDQVATNFFCEFIDAETKEPYMTVGRKISGFFGNNDLESRRQKALECLSWPS